MTWDAMEYSEMILDHFTNPRNIGEIPNADGIGVVGDPECGDHIKVWIKVAGDFHISDIRFKCKGCPAAIAMGSIMTEMAKGRHVDEVSEQVTDEAIEEQAGGLSDEKKHCSNLAAGALYKAIMNYALK